MLLDLLNGCLLATATRLLLYICYDDIAARPNDVKSAAPRASVGGPEGG